MGRDVRDGAGLARSDDGSSSQTLVEKTQNAVKTLLNLGVQWLVGKRDAVLDAVDELFKQANRSRFARSNGHVAGAGVDELVVDISILTSRSSEVGDELDGLDHDDWRRFETRSREK